MASAKKTQYLDSLSIRDIYARGANNTTLPSDQILVTDGMGGTTWQSVSALTGGGAFTTINTTASNVVATVSRPFISILDGPNAGLTVDPTAPNTLRLYANAFNQVSLGGNYTGASTISAYYNPTNRFNSTIKLIAGSNIVISGDSSGTAVSFSAVTASNATRSTLSVLSTNMSGLNRSFASSIASFSSPYAAQPFIQYGSSSLPANGQSTIVFSILPNGKQYKNLNYIVQLSYQSTATSLVKPLSFRVNSVSSFTTYGDISSTFSWTTYGQIF